MVVFNIYAVIVGFLIAAVAVPLHYLAPSLLDGQVGKVVLPLIAFVIAGIAEVFGLKARVFWLPIWLWAPIVATYQLYQGWGVPGLLGGVALLAVALVGLYLALRSMEQGLWKSAPEELAQARNFASNPTTREQAFEHLDSAFLNFLLIDETPEMWAHQREVLAVLRPLLGAGLDPEKAAKIEALDKAYAEKLNNPKAEIDSDLVSEVVELISLNKS